MKQASAIRLIISSVVAAAGRLLRLTASGRPGETFTSREAMQHYGFASAPKAGAEAVAVVQGNRVIVVADDDRRYRIDLADGEVALYTDEGSKIHLRKGGDIEVTCGGTATVTAGGGVTLNGGGPLTGGCVTDKNICMVTGVNHNDSSQSVEATT